MRIIFILLTALFLSSCDPCGNIDCNDNERYEADFRIISSFEGKDLLFGPTASYRKEAIKFYSLKGSDTIFFPFKAFDIKQPEYDSILLVDFISKPETAYIKLSNGDVDTLSLTFGQQQGRCCIYNVIAEVSVNGSAGIFRHDVVEIKK